MYLPRFLVTQEDYDRASPDERLRYNYAVVKDGPISLPDNFCHPKCGQESAEKRTTPHPLND